MFCPVCGTPNLANAERCVKCERPLVKSDAAASSVAPDAASFSPNLGASANAFNTPPSNFNYGYSQPYPPQAGVSDYGNNPPAYSAPLDQAGVSGYGYPPPYTNYSLPVDRVGVSGYNTPPVYGGYNVPVDRVGVSTYRNNFWPRVGAFLIDQIICSLIVFLVFGIPMIVWAAGFFTQHGNEIAQYCNADASNYDDAICNNTVSHIMFDEGGLKSVLAVGVSTGLLAVILVLAYEVILTARGQTLGKKVFGLKVVKADGSPPGFWIALLRQTIGYLVSNSIFDLGFLWVAFDSRNRAWHDFIAGTYVVPAQP